MSTIAYGALTRKRKQAPQGKSKGEGEGKDQWAPALKPWVDSFTALVPAEALVAHEYVMDGYQKGFLSELVIQFAFWALPIGCVVAYFVGERRSNEFNGVFGGLDRWDIVRGVVVPVGAYVGWMLAQNTSILDVYCPVPFFGCPVTEATRYLGVPVLALFLGVLAGWPGADQADQKPPPNA